MGKAENEVEKLTKLFDGLGEGLLNFDTDSTLILRTINDLVERLRHNLETIPHGKYKGHMASGNLWQQLGQGWDIKILGKDATIKLIMPEYYEATDTGRSPTKSGGDGAVKRNLGYTDDLKGWVAAKKLIPPGGIKIKQKRTLKDGTVKEYTTTLTSAQANKRAAYLISRKIHKFGFKGTGWFSKEMKQFTNDMTKAINEEIGRGIKLVIEINPKR